VSILNDLLGTLLANAAVVPAGTSGSIDVFVTDTTQVIIDINGYYAPQISLANGTAAAPSLTFAGDGTSGIYSSGVGTVSVATAGANRLTVAANGNVGIGTNTPSSALDVAGDIRFSGSIRYKLDPVLSFPGGTSNVAVGSIALQSNTGTANTAVGAGAMQTNSSGGLNTAVGCTALGNSHSGSNNTAIGTDALGNINGGGNNIAVGSGAGLGVRGAQSNNIYVGSVGFVTDSATIRIGGNPAIGDAAAQTSFFAAGVRGVTTGLNNAVSVVIDSNGQLGTLSSSRRYKEDIQDMGAASNGLLHLRPVTFRYKKPFADGSKPIQYGLIAEEVAEVYPDLVARSADGQLETVKYQVLDSMLLNEVQRQQLEIGTEREQIRGLERQNEDLQKRLARLEAALVSASGEPRLPQ
jgi:hypothetical protein